MVRVIDEKWQNREKIHIERPLDVKFVSASELFTHAWTFSGVHGYVSGTDALTNYT